MIWAVEKVYLRGEKSASASESGLSRLGGHMDTIGLDINLATIGLEAF